MGAPAARFTILQGNDGLYATTQAVRGKLKPGSWAGGDHRHAVDRAASRSNCRAALIDIWVRPGNDHFQPSAAGCGCLPIIPGMAAVRQTPSLVLTPSTKFSGWKRPFKGYSRVLAKDYEMDEVMLPAGSQAIVFCTSAANRDERKFPDPHRFDVTRHAAERRSHLVRVRMPVHWLASGEARYERDFSVASRVERFHIEEEVRQREQHATRLPKADRFRRIGRSRTRQSDTRASPQAHRNKRGLRLIGCMTCQQRDGLPRLELSAEDFHHASS